MFLFYKRWIYMYLIFFWYEGLFGMILNWEINVWFFIIDFVYLWCYRWIFVGNCYSEFLKLIYLMYKL